MSTSINALTLRRTMGGRGDWCPPQPFGPDGWTMVRRDRTASVIVTCCDYDGHEWVHASIAGDVMPTYDDLVLLHYAVWHGEGYAYQVFAPDSDHVNIHEHALHLWGRLDGARVLPAFGALGTI